jgi:hypothetical protein
MSRLLYLMLPILALAACATSTKELTIANTPICAHVEHHGPLSYDIPVRLSQCFGNQNQEWTVKDGTFANSAGLCMTVQGDQTQNFTPVIAANCNGGPGQRWQFSGTHLVGLGGKCLDVAGGDVAEGSQLVVNACGPAASQQWQVQ